MLFALFQAKFAIITPALITGVCRAIRFWAYLLLWYYLYYWFAPLQHMTWHPDGIFFKMGVLDFAGGTVVHMSAGWAALAGAIFLGKEKHKSKSCSYHLCFTRNRFVWFGWFGFNAGSALGSNGLAVQALGTTL
jgi:Amt family ammonium transporter